ncbi:MAG: aspartate--tRNA ligase, partial [Tissierella sp.]|uniref:aspartate--tRNA ligase n=1 Tax=Tissierella sp. TaxID=41274 RepID=UPI003F98DAAA
MIRDQYCARVTEKDIDKNLCFMGWVQNIRDMGGIIFLDLRDKTGILQVVCDLENLGEKLFEDVETIRNEYVIAVKGDIRKRDMETYNEKLPTGTIELKAIDIEILSKSKTLPFQIEEKKNIREELRLKHRYLDLRKPSLYNNLVLRHNTLKSIRSFLESKEFLEVETPILTKSTPEGARDYLVPSRLHKGKFYALPQSPQIFKQLLMTSGVDRYYQVAKCFRDEDLRSDRQSEFTQVDMELSFSTQEEILTYLEAMFKEVFRNVLDINIKEDFRRITYQEAMDLYGSDKPDIRFGMEIVDLSETLKDTEFKVFKDALKKGSVRAINVKGGNSFTRNEIDELTEKAISYGAKGMAWIAIDDDGEIRSILKKYFSEDTMKELLKKMDAKAGDLIIFSADTIDVI